MDNYNLDRYIEAHNKYYLTALKEIQNGYKESHWMWFIFPQIDGLGSSATSKHYAIRNIGEAKAYMQNKVLSTHMIEICEVLLSLKTNNAEDIFDWPDDMKLKSSMTLFTLANPEEDIFRKILDKYFGGKLDRKTQELI